ncbi:hypothetical protein ND860_18540 [Leptospira levettii]|uniref:hypothetical protein n=1 Tax=Leptospira levettii TaxID=2023178 RepID=UPI00223E084A|nr:hypothetical protein [Leptospira levettii]MCW7498540.1 hypothetical protein [Leptospira levettii]
MKKIYFVFLLLIIFNCNVTRHSFKKINTNYLKKIDKIYNEYVIHFEFGFYGGRGPSPQIKKQLGIIDSLKNCSIPNKRLIIYKGFSKFLNSSSESLLILSDNYKGNKLKRIDLHLILDDKEILDDSVNKLNPISRFSFSNKITKKLHNYNIYHYPITNPIINFEFIETVESASPSFTDRELEDNSEFGKIFGIDVCEALNNIS